MGIVVDISIFLVLGLFMLIGYKRGLAKVIIKLLSFVISIIIALVLYKSVSNIVMERTHIDETIQNKISTSVLPTEFTEGENDNIISKSILDTTTGAVQNVSQSLTIKIIQVGTMILLFIIARILLTLLSLISNIIDKIPVIKQFNKVGGTVYGFLQGSIIILIVFSIISIAGPLISKELINIINSSTLGQFVYNNNILLKML